MMQQVKPLKNYIDDFWTDFENYVKKPDKDRQAGNLELKAVARYKKDLKNPAFVFDRAAVNRFVSYCSAVNIPNKDETIQFYPTSWQCFVIANIFGFYHADTRRRRFRYVYIEIARKNGKTMFSAILALYFLIGDKVLNPESLLLATTKEQASIALRYCKTLVEKSPLLKAETLVMQYSIKPRQQLGLLKTLASNAEKLDGYHPNFTLIDEYHAHPNADIQRVIKSGIVGRKNPIVLTITTAGFNLDYPCFEMRKVGENILTGIVTDESNFVMIFSIDDADDPDDPETWTKSNPNLNITHDISDLKIEFNQAKLMPSLWANFQTKNLNIWTSSSEQWIPENIYQKAYQPIDDELLRGAPCWVGLDLSSTRDMSSAVLLFYDEEKNEYYVKPYFFIVQSKHNRIRIGGIDLTPWINDGFIIQCKSQTIDYDLIFSYFSDWAEIYDIMAVGFDYYNSALIVPRLARELSLNCVKSPQSPGFFNFPLKFLEKLLFDGSIIMSNNPCMRWNFRNVVLTSDSYNNVKISKNKSLDSVDGAVALGMAIAQWLAQNMDDDTINLQNYLDSIKKD